MPSVFADYGSPFGQEMRVLACAMQVYLMVAHQEHVRGLHGMHVVGTQGASACQASVVQSLVMVGQKLNRREGTVCCCQK